MSDNEKEPVKDQFEDEEVDFSKLKKKKKSKKKVDFEAEPVAETEQVDEPQAEEAEEDPDAMFSELKKKKKKKSKSVEERKDPILQLYQANDPHLYQPTHLHLLNRQWKQYENYSLSLVLTQKATETNA
ncbi:hypothetical protein G6F56_003619 [Rhizopus delemar]|nr:hypothetical protein G6F56_003619 [Rhizopus delemar]